MMPKRSRGWNVLVDLLGMLFYVMRDEHGAARRLLIATTTSDALSDEDIRTVSGPSAVSLWAACVTLTDLIGLRLNRTIIMDDGICNIHAAALSLVNISDDGLVFDALVGKGTLRIPVTVTTSLIFHLTVEPVA